MENKSLKESLSETKANRSTDSGKIRYLGETTEY